MKGGRDSRARASVCVCGVCACILSATSRLLPYRIADDDTQTAAWYS